MYVMMVDMREMVVQVVEMEGWGMVGEGKIPTEMKEKNVFPVVWLKSYPDSQKDKKACVCFL